MARWSRRRRLGAGISRACPTSMPDSWSVARCGAHRVPCTHGCRVGRYRVSAGVFWQVHLGAPAALLSAVLSLVGDCPEGRVVDLYAGAGLFAIPLAEAVGPAGWSSRWNGTDGPAPTFATTAPTSIHYGCSRQRSAPSWSPHGIGRPDVVVLDPAREGAGTRVMGALDSHASWITRLVYVSCDPASFARDVRVLLDAGWGISVLRAFDIFPMTEHVELVAALEPPSPA